LDQCFIHKIYPVNPVLVLVFFSVLSVSLYICLQAIYLVFIRIGVLIKSGAVDRCVLGSNETVTEPWSPHQSLIYLEQLPGTEMIPHQQD